MYKLKSVTLHITNKCTHECPFCYYRLKEQQTEISTKNERFSFETLKSIIDELAKNNVEEIILLGGDPAEYSYFLELIKYAHEKGLVVTSVSNTHKYNSEPLELAKYLSVCETTIHGGREFHDDFCGSVGAYDNALKRLSQFKNLGCSIGITINIMPSNVNNIHSIVGNIIEEYGNILDFINIQRIVPNGRANVEDNHYLSKTDLINAFAQIEKINLDYNIDIQCEDGFPLCLIPKKYWRFAHKCEWGYNKLSINGDGGVSRCGTDPRFRLGNVLQTPLSEIWNNSTNLKEFRQKEFLPQKCKKCSNLELCGGGCVLGTWAGTEFNHDMLLTN